ncbi:MAG TPA: hypothetical protein VEH04_20715 [Verrucomicrobiae bacterium]|nr:hypothetical protein [Verrucomicrobiae bacterium]
MPTLPPFTRPTFEAALTEWERILTGRNLPADVIWIFDENLIFERAETGDTQIAFQRALTPLPPGAERIAFNYFSDFEARIVFYRVGSCRNQSVCMMLCDSWFEGKEERDGFQRRDDWLMSFYPGQPVELEETADEARWKKRLVRDRPLHDLDFSMTLRAVHEILAHGRVLTSYEHYALRLLHSWSKLPGQRAP